MYSIDDPQQWYIVRDADFLYDLRHTAVVGHLAFLFRGAELQQCGKQFDGDFHPVGIIPEGPAARDRAHAPTAAAGMIHVIEM